MIVGAHARNGLAAFGGRFVQRIEQRRDLSRIPTRRRDGHDRNLWVGRARRGSEAARLD
jgi:hypothetical protein